MAEPKEAKLAIQHRVRLMELGLTAINKSRNRNLSNGDYKAFAEKLLSEFPGLQVTDKEVQVQFGRDIATSKGRLGKEEKGETIKATPALKNFTPVYEVYKRLVDRKAPAHNGIPQGVSSSSSEPAAPVAPPPVGPAPGAGAAAAPVQAAAPAAASGPLSVGAAAAASGAGPSSPPAPPSVQGRPAKRARAAAPASTDTLLSEVVNSIRQANQVNATLLYMLLNPAQQHVLAPSAAPLVAQLGVPPVGGLPPSTVVAGGQPPATGLAAPAAVASLAAQLTPEAQASGQPR